MIDKEQVARERAKEHYWKNREENLKRSRLYRLNNKEELSIRRKPAQAAYRKNLRTRILDAYGRKCSNPECGYDKDERALDLDHIYGKKAEGHEGLGAQRIYQIIIRENFPKDRYRILCRNCNWLKFQDVLAQK